MVLAHGTNHPFLHIIIIIIHISFLYYYLSNLSIDRVATKGMACTRVLPTHKGGTTVQIQKCMHKYKTIN